jgi:arsenate reductase-like glutaredoxin family protein
MRDPFELEITEEPPTAEQLRTILEHMDKGDISQVVEGSHDQKEALRRFKESKETFLRPVVSGVYKRKRVGRLVWLTRRRR